MICPLLQVLSSRKGSLPYINSSLSHIQEKKLLFFLNQQRSKQFRSWLIHYFMQFYYFQYFARFLSGKGMHYNMHITNLWNEYLQNFKSEKFLSRESHAVAVFFEKLLEMIEPIIQKELVQTIIKNVVRAYI